MAYDTIEDWIRDENGHKASDVDQILVAYWLFRNDVTVVDNDERRTSQLRTELADRLDHEVETALENLNRIGVVEKFEPPSRVFIQNERTGEAFFSPNDEAFPPSLYEEISRLVYDIHCREGQAGDGEFPGELHPPEVAPIADGGEETPESTGDDRPLRAFVAAELDVAPPDVERALVDFEDVIPCMEQFDELVEAIAGSEDVTRGVAYDRVGWRNRANRWALSETATRVEENESLPT